MNLYHYFDRSVGPFKSLSDVPLEEANALLRMIAQNKPQTLCAQRSHSYMTMRLYYENMLRTAFTKKGGKIEREHPYYMVVEHSPWLSTWFENSAFIKIPIEKFDSRTISFTYGDSHPTFSSKVKDGKEYRHKLYTYDEILKIIEKYGLPQAWNDDGQYGPERYVEAHIWSDEVIKDYLG